MTHECRSSLPTSPDYQCEKPYVATPHTAKSEGTSAFGWIHRLVPTAVRTEFLTNVVKLSSATGMGMLLSVAAAPLLTRLYHPSDFGLLSVYSSVFYMVVAVASLRYDFALPLAKGERSAANLLAVCGLLLCVTTGLLVGATAIWGQELCDWLGRGDLLPVLWLLPCGFVAAGAFQILNYWSVRHKAYSGLARANIARSSTEAATQIGMGLAAVGPVGLLLGVVGGYIVAASLQIKSTLQRDWQLLRQVQRRRMLHVARRFRSYPTFAAPASFLNSAGLRMPPLILLACYNPVVVGWFALSQRVLGLPMRLVGKSISDVYFGEAAECVRERPEDLMGMLRRTVGRLTIAALPLLLFAVVAPAVFAIVFGSEWRAAGEYCRVLVVCYAIGFVVISISQLTTYGFNHWQLGWDTFRLIATSIPLLVAYQWQCSAYVAIAWFAVGASVSYLLLFGLNVLAIRRLVLESRLRTTTKAQTIDSV